MADADLYVHNIPFKQPTAQQNVFKPKTQNLKWN